MKLKVRTSGKAAIVLGEIRRKTRPSLYKASIRAADTLLADVKKEVRVFAKKRTGLLEKSFQSAILARPTGPRIRILTDSPYARIYETGGVIKPKRAKKLSIPKTARAKAARSPRNFPGKLFRPKGTNVLLEKTGGANRLQFVLTDRVYVKPRGYLTKAAERSRPKLRDIFAKELQEAHRAAGRAVK